MRRPSLFRWSTGAVDSRWQATIPLANRSCPNVKTKAGAGGYGRRWTTFPRVQDGLRAASTQADVGGLGHVVGQRERNVRVRLQQGGGRLRRDVAVKDSPDDSPLPRSVAIDADAP